MLCKYYLQLGSSTIDTTSSDCMDVSRMIKNLDSIKVTYQRVDLGGVVRKCGSSIEFTGKAYDAIIEHYGQNYLRSKGVFAVFIADNNWEYSKAWECPLDFATLKYDAHVCTIGCVDNSAAAVIKANKKSKYEFEVAQLKDSSNLLYDGVVTRRNLSFSIIGETPEGEETADMVSSMSLYLNNQGTHGVYVPGIGVSASTLSSEKISVFDQHEDAMSFQDENGKNEGWCINRMIQLETDGHKRAGFIKCLADCTVHIKMGLTFQHRNPDLMETFLQYYQDSFVLAIDDKIVWKKNVVAGTNVINIDADYEMKEGQTMAFVQTTLCKNPREVGWYMEPVVSYVGVWLGPSLGIKYNVNLRWGSNTQTAYVSESHYTDSPIEINAIRPVILLRKLLDKMFEDRDDIRTVCSIDYADPVLERTLIVAAESIRRITTNKIYTSFADFCSFMESVFGYVYTIEDVGEDEEGCSIVRIAFTPRSYHFYDGEAIKTLRNVNNLSYELDESKVYSDVEIGYKKKDYDNENSAMNEFNFTNHYKTDTNITDNTLSLISPYRADCYGIEELLLKSSSDESTDSDNDVFLVVASSPNPENGLWRIDRSLTVWNAYSSTVFNAAIAPNMIVQNNEDYFGVSIRKLKFTSSEGNSSAIIGGNPMSADIEIADQLFKVGRISIDTDDHNFPESWDGLIEFEYAGKTYSGYLDSIDIDFAKLGTITYNLIEQCIE